MNHVERFRAVMNFQPVDRLPQIEWASWWSETITSWQEQGLPADLKTVSEIDRFFGLDPYQQFSFPAREATEPPIAGTVRNMDDYLRILPLLYPDHSEKIEALRPWAERQRRGEVVVWISLEGFFWFPRTLMGIEPHIYAFYDQPELMHRMNEDLCRFNLRLLDEIAHVCTPTFMTFYEDMSYNHGPMISQQHFDEYLAPYYRVLSPKIRELNIISIVDTDGDVTMMVPWLLDVGLQGVLPLERQAHVDGMQLRKSFPELLMVGHYDKMVMNRGEEAIRAEFERLLPLMKAGGFIPSVDHQTPPGVTIEQYRVYLRLLAEYMKM